MSGRNRPVDVQTAVQSGATDYIVKPMDILVLEEKINRLSKGASADWNSIPFRRNLGSTQAGIFMTTTSINENRRRDHVSLQMPVGSSFNFNSELLIAKA